MKRSRNLGVLLFTAIMMLLLGACANDASDQVVVEPPGQENPSATDPGNPGEEPGGLPGDRYLTISVVGGFMAPGGQFAQTPVVTVYADGTVLAPGSVPAIYPGPAVAPLLTGQFSAETMATITQAVHDTGLSGETLPDPGTNMNVADAGTTRISVITGGRERTIEAYALEMDAGTSVTPAQQEVRANLRTFVSALQELANRAATTAYQPVGYAVLSLPVTAADPTLPPNELNWPEGLPEPTENNCLALLGDHAETLTGALGQANQTTLWKLTTGTVTLAFRPLLPDETSCS